MYNLNQLIMTKKQANNKNAYIKVHLLQNHMHSSLKGCIGENGKTRRALRPLRGRTSRVATVAALRTRRLHM
jgi:AMMECR1 domain-containing protein